MSEDSFYLLSCYIIYWIVATAILKHKKKEVRINLVIQAIYTFYFQYKLLTDANGGMGLVWLVFNMFTIGVHMVVCILLAIFKRTTSN